MKFEYNRNKETLLNVIHHKAEKKNIVIKQNGDRLEFSLLQGKFNADAEAVPVAFRGKISEKEEGCVLEGKFTFGFYLQTLVVVAAVLIIARFAWSAYKMQTDNMIMCVIAAVLLVIVAAVVAFKAKKTKKIILEFLGNLNMK